MIVYVWLFQVAACMATSLSDRGQHLQKLLTLSPLFSKMLTLLSEVLVLHLHLLNLDSSTDDCLLFFCKGFDAGLDCNFLVSNLLSTDVLNRHALGRVRDWHPLTIS